MVKCEQDKKPFDFHQFWKKVQLILSRISFLYFLLFTCAWFPKHGDGPPQLKFCVCEHLCITHIYFWFDYKVYSQFSEYILKDLCCVFMYIELSIYFHFHKHTHTIQVIYSLYKTIFIKIWLHSFPLFRGIVLYL